MYLNSDINFLRYKRFHVERDVYIVINQLFLIERDFRLGKKLLQEYEIVISKETFSNWNVAKIEEELEDVLRFVLSKNIKLKFKQKDTNRRKWNNKTETFPKLKRICLFSGGVDSTMGLQETLKQYKTGTGALFICHGDLGNIGIVIKKIYREFSKRFSFPIKTFYAPKIFNAGYSQLRGLLYFVYASIYANLTSAEELIITECGPTMYQTKFSPFDLTTMTTHPYILKKVIILNSLFFKRKIKISLPFEDLTKAEILRLGKSTETLIEKTHSCLTARWIPKGQKINDGTCYGCIVRLFGKIVADIDDLSFRGNPITDQNIFKKNSSARGDIVSLLSFSIDFLMNYEKLDWYIKEDIELFDKKDLFKRFTLDNLAALYSLKTKNSLQKIFESFLNEFNNDDLLIKRLEEVRMQKNKPNFNNYI